MACGLLHSSVWDRSSVCNIHESIRLLGNFTFSCKYSEYALKMTYIKVTCGDEFVSETQNLTGFVRTYFLVSMSLMIFQFFRKIIAILKLSQRINNFQWCGASGNSWDIHNKYEAFCRNRKFRRKTTLPKKYTNTKNERSIACNFTPNQIANFAFANASRLEKVVTWLW